MAADSDLLNWSILNGDDCSDGNVSIARMHQDGYHLSWPYPFAIFYDHQWPRVGQVLRTRRLLQNNFHRRCREKHKHYLLLLRRQSMDGHLAGPRLHRPQPRGRQLLCIVKRRLLNRNACIHILVRCRCSRLVLLLHALYRRDREPLHGYAANH